MSKGIVYYTDNRCEERIAMVVRRNISKCCQDMKITSVSHYPIRGFGNNIVVDMDSGPVTMFKQILIGLENCEADVVFLTEHDVLYHPSHFAFDGVRLDRFYYNQNRWSVNSITGEALYRETKAMSCLVARRALLIKYFTELIAFIGVHGFNRRKMGFSPGTHHFGNFDNYHVRTFKSEYPNLDVRHGNNLSKYEFEKDTFDTHGKSGWILDSMVPGWGVTKGRFSNILKECY